MGPLTEQAGIRVLLHEQGSMIFPFEEGFSVSPGMSTSVGIKKVRETFWTNWPLMIDDLEICNLDILLKFNLYKYMYEFILLSGSNFNVYIYL